MTTGSATNVSLRETIVMVRWALIITCAYLFLFADSNAGGHGFGLAVIATFLASNLLIGRLPEDFLGTREFKVGIAAFDTLFIATSLYLAHQLSVEILLLFLAVVVLAAVGLELAVIARVTLALAAADLLLIWLTGNQGLRTSVLLRAPFLLSAALVYGALVEAGLSRSGDSRRIPLIAIDTLSSALVSQRDAIGRCQAALPAETAPGAVVNALNEIAGQNQQMQATMGRL